MSEYLSSYSNKKVFITGHTGFKGSWLTFLLKEIGAEVKGYALKPLTEPNHFNLLGLENSILNVEADLREGNRLKKEILDFQPEFIFHLGAQALVKRSYSNPVETYETNIMGSVNLLEAVRYCDSLRSLVYITSDKCYENVEWLRGYRENDRLGGHDPYSASKSSAEIIFSSFYRSYLSQKENLGAASARAGNVIGGGDWSEDRIIPDCIKSIQNKIPLKLRNPNSTRPWQHVLEPISGYLSLGYYLSKDPQKFSGPWNFGPSSDDISTVEEVVKEIFKHLGKGSIEISQQKNLIHEANLLQLNCDKAQQILKWTPRWDIKKALKKTSEWYEAYIRNDLMKEVSLKQIKDYYPELS